MIGGKYSTHSDYRSTNEEGFSKIPSHWTTKRVRFVLLDGADGIKIGPFGSALKLDGMVNNGVRVYGQENVIKKNFSLGKRRISNKKFEEMSVYKICPNDLLITMMGTSGKCELVPEEAEEGIIDSHLLRLRVQESEISPEFFRLLIDESVEIEHQVKVLGKGSIMHGLNSSIVKNLMLPLPDREEQNHIINFLDHETARIDILIEKQQQLIKLLKEKRQAVISHAVTKGLNPDAPMKDSGVEWLGEVPAHWEVCKLKHVKHVRANAFVDGPFGSNLKSEHFIDGGDVYVIESNFATTGILERLKLKTVSTKHFNTIRRSEAEEGDIIIAKIGARYGSSAVLPVIDKPAVVSGNSLKLTVNQDKCIVEYANKLLKHLKKEEAMDDGVNVTAQPALSLGSLNNLPFLAPAIEEQSLILRHLDKQSSIFDDLIDKAGQFIQLSKERRLALISAAVTGKIDVRNWKPKSGEATTSEPSTSEIQSAQSSAS